MRLRLVLALILVVLVAVGSLMVFVRLDFNQALRNYLFRGGMMGMQNVVEELEEYYQQNGSWDGVETILDSSPMGMGMMGRGRHMGGQSSIIVVNADGWVVADTSGTYLGTSLGEGDLRNSVTLVDAGGKTIGYLIVPGMPGFQPGDEEPLLALFNQAAVRAGLLAGLLALLLGLILASQVLRPVQQLTQAAESMSSGNLRQRVPEKGSDELGKLARSFNRMSASLEESEARRRALTADIAHELRTPLAVQRAQVEAMQDGVYPITPENLQTVLDQNEFLSRLVDDLRTLALADAGELVLEYRSVDLQELLQRVMERFRPSAQAEEVELVFKQENQACPTIQGDSGRIEQILNNLIGNSLRYTPAGGKITLDLACDSSQLTMTIQDTGPGIPEDALPYVFDRFYRVDRSRSRQEGGSGLGLSIARQFARAHGGDVTAANSPQGGAVFQLVLPIKSEKQRVNL